MIARASQYWQGIAILGLLLAAGCTAPQNGGKAPPASHAQTGSSQPPSSSSSSNSSEEPKKVLGISWNGCKGLGVSLQHANALGLDQGDVPAGWETDGLQNNIYQVIVNQCARVSVGPFERGPASVVIEMDDAVAPPASCEHFNGGYDDSQVLYSLWVDDTEVADYLKATYGMPVHFGAITFDLKDSPAGQVQTWNWNETGSSASTLSGLRPTGPENNATYLDRIAWKVGAGVSFIDLRQDRILPLVTGATGEGVLAPPMRYGQHGAAPFAGLASIWNQADQFGPIYRFGDTQCKKPLD